MRSPPIKRFSKKVNKTVDICTTYVIIKITRETRKDERDEKNGYEGCMDESEKSGKS